MIMCNFKLGAAHSAECQHECASFLLFVRFTQRVQTCTNCFQGNWVIYSSKKYQNVNGLAECKCAARVSALSGGCEGDRDRSFLSGTGCLLAKVTLRFCLRLTWTPRSSAEASKYHSGSIKKMKKITAVSEIAPPPTIRCFVVVSKSCVNIGIHYVVSTQCNPTMHR